MLGKFFMNKAFFTLVLALVLGSFSAAQKKSPSAPVSGEELVRDAATALLKLQSYELNVIFDQSIDDGKYTRTFHTYVDTSFDLSGGRKRIRMVSRRQVDSMIIVSDGDGYWVYHSSNHTYEHRASNLPPEVYNSTTPGFSGTLSAENLPASMQSAQIIRNEMLPLGDRSESCDVVVVHLKPGMAPPEYQVKDNELTLWLSHKYHVPMKVTAIFLHNTPDGKPQAIGMAVLVKKFHPNVPLPLSTWTFVPPPDSQAMPGTSAPGLK
jgi:outer membrane lipoprotein-sorting protein